MNLALVLTYIHNAFVSQAVIWEENKELPFKLIYVKRERNAIVKCTMEAVV